MTPDSPSVSGLLFSVRTHERIDEIPADAWDALAEDDHPFTSHAFLHALEASGSLRADAGWSPRHLTLWRDGALIAAAPAYLKTNSHGEFVFDQGWAHAAAQAGIDYYPKLLLAVPYSPVNGQRLLARDPSARAVLATNLPRLAEALGVSGVHVNFGRASDHGPLDDAGFTTRHDVQFHWRNETGWRDWDTFSGALDSKRRKNIRQERERLRRQDWRFDRLEGDAITDAVLDTAFALYQRTFTGKYNHPALTRGFFARLHASMPHALLIVHARSPEGANAMAICLQSSSTLYGRYWGSEVDTPGLHFETCYYQGIEHCLATGRTLFEPGAQGEHKLARGFLPSMTESRHWLRDRRLHQAVAHAMVSERDHVARYRADLFAHSPFAGPRP